MNASPDPDTPVRTAPMALWRVAEAFMRILFALFGAPEDVAERHTLTGKPYRLLLSWLRCGEAMMRRLLLIEAATYPKPNTRPLLHPQHKRVRKPLGFDAEHPEKWRVSFRCFVRDSGIGTRASGNAPIPDNRTPNPDLRTERWNYTRFKPATFHSAWPLAERYEALLRVFNDPAPYAQRLAKRLHALPHRLGEILRAPPEAAHRVERFEALTHAAAARWRIPNTS